MTDILLIYLQVGVTLFGFASIATVIVNVSATTSDRLFAIRLINLMANSMVFVLGAIIPLVTGQLVDNPAGTYAISAIAVLTVGGGSILALQAKLTCIQLRDGKLKRWRYIPTWTLGLIGGVFLVLTVFAGNKTGYYLTALNCSLMIVLINAVFVLLSFPIYDALFNADRSGVSTSDAQEQSGA